MTMLFSDKGWVASRVVHSSPDEVFNQLLAKLREEMDSLGTGYADALSVDAEKRTVTVTGHWWYQGTYVVKSESEGSCVTYRVRNIAARARFLAFLDKPAYSRRMQRELDTRLQSLS